MRRTLEDLLLEEKLLDEATLRQVRRHARRTGVSLVRAAIEEAQLSDERLADMVARRLRLDRIDLEREPVDEDAVREVPYDLAEARRLLPLSIDRTEARRVIRVAMADPLDLDAVDEIELSTGCVMEPVVARAGQIKAAVERHYRRIITKIVPRHSAEPGEGGAARARGQEGKSLDLRHRALIELLVERGVIDEESYAAAIERLARAAEEPGGE
jgi:hypothetical protein